MFYRITSRVCNFSNRLTQLWKDIAKCNLGNKINYSSRDSKQSKDKCRSPQLWTCHISSLQHLKCPAAAAPCPPHTPRCPSLPANAHPPAGRSHTSQAHGYARCQVTTQPTAFSWTGCWIRSCLSLEKGGPRSSCECSSALLPPPAGKIPLVRKGEMASTCHIENPHVKRAICTLTDFSCSRRW